MDIARIFWDVLICWLVSKYWLLEEEYFLHFLGEAVQISEDLDVHQRRSWILISHVIFKN